MGHSDNPLSEDRINDVCHLAAATIATFTSPSDAPHAETIQALIAEYRRQAPSLIDDLPTIEALGALVDTIRHTDISPSVSEARRNQVVGAVLVKRLEEMGITLHRPSMR